MLDRYGVFAQLSALVPIAVILLFRLGIWVLSERRRQQDYAAVPTSPGLKRERLSGSGALLRRWRRLEWWLESDVGGGWGVRGRWIAGLAWGAWLLFLSVHRTGDGRSFYVSCSFCFESVGKVRLVSLSSCNSSAILPFIEPLYLLYPHYAIAGSYFAGSCG